jgi:hypothetical protein
MKHEIHRETDLLTRFDDKQAATKLVKKDIYKMQVRDGGFFGQGFLLIYPISYVIRPVSYFLTTEQRIFHQLIEAVKIVPSQVKSAALLNNDIFR